MSNNGYSNVCQDCGDHFPTTKYPAKLCTPCRTAKLNKTCIDCGLDFVAKRIDTKLCDCCKAKPKTTAEKAIRADAPIVKCKGCSKTYRETDKCMGHCSTQCLEDHTPVHTFACANCGKDCQRISPDGMVAFEYSVTCSDACRHTYWKNFHKANLDHFIGGLTADTEAKLGKELVPLLIEGLPLGLRNMMAWNEANIARTENPIERENKIKNWDKRRKTMVNDLNIKASIEMGITVTEPNLVYIMHKRRDKQDAINAQRRTQTELGA